MSLLNDALRDLEKREPKGERAQPVSAGLAVTKEHAKRGLGRWIMVIACLVILVAGGWAFYHFRSPAGMARLHSQPMTSLPKPAVPDKSHVAAPPPPQVVQSSNVHELKVSHRLAKRSAPTPKPVSLTDTRAPTVTAVPAMHRSAPASAKASAPASQAAGHSKSVRHMAEHAATHSAQPQARVAIAKVSNPASPMSGAGASATAAASQNDPSVVSQAPQSPEQKDRHLARRLASLVQQGNVGRAVQLLKARVTDGHDWPKSRKALVTALLANRDYPLAEGLLPPAVTEDYPDLRMLKGRLILATRGAKAALRYLQKNIPDIDAWPDYHATLATLLQQTGKPARAAKVWSALLQLDNSNAAWWAGFGIALDSSGQPGKARQAYRQALLLPGLNAALNRYIQSRLSQLPQQ